jgi:hypothetical protein
VQICKFIYLVTVKIWKRALIRLVLFWIWGRILGCYYDNLLNLAMSWKEKSWKFIWPKFSFFRTNGKMRNSNKIARLNEIKNKICRFKAKWDSIWCWLRKWENNLLLLGSLFFFFQELIIMVISVVFCVWWSYYNNKEEWWYFNAKLSSFICNDHSTVIIRCLKTIHSYVNDKFNFKYFLSFV